MLSQQTEERNNSQFRNKYHEWNGDVAARENPRINTIRGLNRALPTG